VAYTTTRSSKVLRLYWRGDPLPFATHPRVDLVVIEWSGQLGHPSSYGMLGGHAGTGVLVDERGPWKRSLARRADAVEFGLPAEYSKAIQPIVADRVRVTQAANGAAGSSIAVFRDLAALLVRLVDLEKRPNSDELWALWDDVRAL